MHDGRREWPVAGCERREIPKAEPAGYRRSADRGDAIPNDDTGIGGRTGRYDVDNVERIWAVLIEAESNVVARELRRFVCVRNKGDRLRLKVEDER